MSKVINFFSLLLVLLLAVPLLAAGSYQGGTGTAADPYRILTAAHLVELGLHPEDYDNHFILLADIDLDPDIPGNKKWQKAIIAPNNYNGQTFDGFPFTGSFDGNGKSVKNLNFLNPSSHLGLFGKVDAAGMILNLRVENAFIEAYYFDSYNVGFLAGENAGTIINCRATGRRDDWHNDNSNCPTNVGGLVGINTGFIFDCSSAGKIIGGLNAGGLVGHNLNGYIIQCHSTCDLIDCRSNSGGLVGCNEGASLISYSYATGSVQGGWPAAGLAGYSQGSYQTPAVITHCYATGSVEYGAGLVGDAYSHAIIKNSYSVGAAQGFVGSFDSSYTQVINCFWDTDTGSSSYSGGGTGLHTAQIKQRQTFLDAGWDFDSTWEIVEGRTYPYFQWQPDPLANLCQDSEPFPVGDLNSDCVVNLEDFMLFTSHWLEDIRR